MSTIRSIYYNFYFSRFFVRLNDLEQTCDTQPTSQSFEELRCFLEDLKKFPYSYFNINPDVRDSLGFSALPESALKTCYRENERVLVQLEHVLLNREEEKIPGTFSDLNLFMSQVYRSLQRSSGTRWSYLPHAAVAFFLLLMILSIPALRKRYKQEKAEYAMVATEESRFLQRIDDLMTLKAALDQYHNDHKAYPKSSGGWDGIYSAFGESKQEWIPGIVPEYIKELPTDPRNNDNPRDQYLYISDGADYKLISHNAENMDRIIREHADMIDPTRASWAFGVWSEHAKNW